MTLGAVCAYNSLMTDRGHYKYRTQFRYGTRTARALDRLTRLTGEKRAELLRRLLREEAERINPPKSQ